MYTLHNLGLKEYICRMLFLFQFNQLNQPWFLKGYTPEKIYIQSTQPMFDKIYMQDSRLVPVKPSNQPQFLKGYTQKFSLYKLHNLGLKEYICRMLCLFQFNQLNQPWFLKGYTPEKIYIQSTQPRFDKIYMQDTMPVPV